MKKVKGLKKRLCLLLAGTIMAASVLPGCAASENNGGGGGGTAVLKEIRAVRPERAEMPSEQDFTDSSGNFDYEKWNALYEKWREERNALRDAAAPYQQGLAGFSGRVAEKLLYSEDRENRVYSPINIYLAMSMLAETTDGETRRQILDLMGIQDMETLRSSSDTLWNVNYSDGGDMVSKLSNSVWLDNDFAFKEDTVNLLAEKYHADTFSGEAGSDEMNKAVSAWINEATGDLLKDVTDGIKIDPAIRMVLISAILYKARWSDEFNAENTTQETFHTPDGDITVDMMHAERSGEYFYGDGFGAVRLYLYNGGYMYIILPDEGTDVYDMPGNAGVRGLVSGDPDAVDSAYIRISLSVPKTDIMSDLDLKEALKELGITDVFDRETADFTPMTDESIWLEKVEHAARFKMDEEGVSAAAFTMMMAAGAGAPPEEHVDFNVDRPYYFAIASESGSILFEGIVNDPNGEN